MSDVTVLANFWKSSGITVLTGGQVLMIAIGFFLVFIAVIKKLQAQILIPLALGIILANVPISFISGPTGFLGSLYSFGIVKEFFLIFFFIGLGAMADFGPLIANPKTGLLGLASQVGIFVTFIITLLLANTFGFSLKGAAVVGILGAADGATAMFLSSKLSPEIFGAVVVTAYFYIAVLPVLQPPIMRMLVTEEERKIRMQSLKGVSRTAKLVTASLVLILCIIFVPSVSPLVGAFVFGNILKESRVADKLTKAARDELLDITTIFLGLTAGSMLSASSFLKLETLGIVILGFLAVITGTFTGVLLAKIMNKLSKEPVNPLIGAAGVSALPVASRVVYTEGARYDAKNQLLLHAMGPNVAGLIASLITAGIFLSILG